MKTVEMKKETLREILTHNKEKHRELFEEAWEAFREKAIANYTALLENAKKAKRGERIQLYLGLDQPEDHTDDYQRALEMLEYEEREVIPLSESEFARLVQDDWNWKMSFAQAYTSNTGKFSE